MKNNEKTNYFARYLQKKQQYLALKNKQECPQQSTEPIKLNVKIKKTEESPNTQSSNYYLTQKKRTHQKVSSTPIELIIPSKKSDNMRYTFEDQVLYDDLNYPPPNKLSCLSKIMTVKHINYFERKIKYVLNIIEAFEKENNLNVDQHKCSFIYPEKESNTDRITNNNIRMKVYKSLPHSARHNRTIHNPSFSSKESTNHFSKKISTHVNNNINGGIPLNIYRDVSSKKKQYKSCSIKKVKLSHSNHKDNKQKAYKLRNNVNVIKQMNTISNQKQRSSITQLKVLIIYLIVIH